MSNYLSIALVTAAIHDVVQTAVHSVVDGAHVRIGPPRVATPGVREVCVYLYHLTPNPQRRNDDLATRRADGSLEARPQVAVTMHYLISFSGEERLETEIMLGKVATVLHAFPILRPELLRALAATDGSYPQLAAANLPTQPEHVRLTPEYLSLEELTKLWTVFFQIAHRPSLQYVVSPVLLDADLTPTPTPTVSRRPRRLWPL